MMSNLMSNPTSQIQGMDEEIMSYMTGNGCQQQAGMNAFDPYYNYQMHANGYMQTPPQFMSSVVASTGPGAPLYFGPPHHRKGSFSSEDTDVDENTTTNNNHNNMHQRDNQHDSSNYGPPGANLFIFHLPNDLTNYGLYLLFRPYGRVLSVRIMVNYTTGLSRGYGFVSFSKLEEAALAIKNMHGYNIGRKRLKVQLKMGEARAAAHAAAAGMNRGRSFSDSSAGADGKWVPPKKEKGRGSGGDDDSHETVDGNGDIDGTVSGLTSAAASVAGD
jgi:hypothetical protein